MAPAILSPASGSTLDGSIQVFTWDLGGIPVDSTWLYAGSAIGGSDHGRRQVGADTEGSLGDLPVDGSDVFVRVWYRTGGQWRSLDARYRAAASDGLPQFVSPRPDGRLQGSTQTFRWNPGRLNAAAWWLYVGDDVGGSDYAAVRVDGTNGDDRSELAATVGGLPTDERTINARLYFLTGGSWYFLDRIFQAAPEEVPTRDELTRQLQRLVGVTADGDVGPQTRTALNRNWLGRPSSFDPSFSARLTNTPALVRWVQERVIAQGGPAVRVTGVFNAETETAVKAHLGRGGVVAAESYVRLLEP